MPITRSQNQEDLETKVSTLEHKLDSLHMEFQAALKKKFKEMTQLLKGNNFEPTLEDPHSFHYEHTHSFHSPWGSPYSWTKVPKVDMHKFDGSNRGGWVSQMEQYFSLKDIQDDETKLHVGVLNLDQEHW
jgi:hypothetical protein